MPRRDDTFENAPWNGRAVLHVDMDAFFASIEQLDHPGWRGRPVIVGGAAASRGVVAAASYEARRFGVRSAMPSATAARLCPDAVWAPPRFERYREVSLAVRAVFDEVTPHVQPVSIDEAYLDVTPGGTGVHPVTASRRIQARIGALGLSCSVGVATSKTVAKIASDLDKPHGLVVVPPGEEAAFLAPMPVEALQGVGKMTAGRLRALGVRTLGGLAALDPATAARVLGSYGPEAVRRAAGVDERPVAAGEPRKSVSKEHTFAADVSEAADVEGALARLAEEVGARLRRAGVAGRTVTVKLRFGDFTTRTVRRTLPRPVDSERDFLPVAMRLLHSAWSPGVGLRLVGVGLSGFEERAEQLELLPDAPSQPECSSSDAVMRGVDAVRERFGSGAIGVGRRGLRGEPGRPQRRPKETGEPPVSADEGSRA
ncbi:MAG: DNA polymerase IV [Coriobacteriia bacterium]|nr:DNA polymerase IV [Coriobacteriia bacterium]